MTVHPPVMFVPIFTMLLLLQAGCDASNASPVSGRTRIHVASAGGIGDFHTTSFTTREVRWNRSRMSMPSTILLDVDLPPSLGGTCRFEGSLVEIVLSLRQLNIRSARFDPGGTGMPTVIARWTDGSCSLEVEGFRAFPIVVHAVVAGARTEARTR